MERAQFPETLWNSHWRGQDETVCWGKEVKRILGYSNSEHKTILYLRTGLLQLTCSRPSYSMYIPCGYVHIRKECLSMHIMIRMQHYLKHHYLYWHTFRVCGEQRQGKHGEYLKVLGSSSTCRDLYLNIGMVRRAVHFGFSQDKLLGADVEI